MINNTNQIGHQQERCGAARANHKSGRMSEAQMTKGGAACGAVSCQRALRRGGLRATVGAAPGTVEGRRAGKALQGGGPRKVLKPEESQATLVLRTVPSPEGTAGGGRAVSPRCMFSLLLLS